MSIPNDFKGLRKYCNITCSDCLDTKYFWRERKVINVAKEICKKYGKYY